MHKFFAWLAGIGGAIIATAIIGSFSMLLTLRDSVTAMRTTQTALVSTVGALNDKINSLNASLSGAITRAEYQRTLVSIDSRLRELEKGSNKK